MEADNDKSNGVEEEKEKAKVAPEQPQQKAAGKREGERRRKSKEEQPHSEDVLLFDKYNTKDVVINDQSLASGINLVAKRYPNSYGRRKNPAYYYSHISIVERLINKLMRGGTGQKVGGRVIRTKGRLQGKKMKVMHIVESAFEIVSKESGKNPVQVLIDAMQNAAPIEGVTRVRYGGITYNVATDLSSEKRVSIALDNIALASVIGAFKNRKTLAESLANELILASNNDPNSYAIKKRSESERMARSAR